jgi:hypothetical protein
MGKSKDIAAKEIMLSTTRGGMNLPSRPKFSPANATPAIKKKYAALHSLPLSKMFMPTDTENELLDDSMDDEVTHDSSNPSSSKNAELNRETAKANASKSIPPHDIVAFGRAFVDADLDDLDIFDALRHASLGDLFPTISKTNEPIIYIKYSAYEFFVNPDIIELVEKNKFYGKDDEYPGDHIIQVHDIANLYGNNEVQKHYYFLKLFPFSLGGDARNWYNSLPPKTITSKDACVHLFYRKYFTNDKIHAIKIDICKFSQGKKETIPQAWGMFSKMTRNCHVHGMQDNELLDTFYNGLTEIYRSYLYSIAGNIFRNMTIEEAEGLFGMMAENNDNWTLNEEDNIGVIPKERGVLTLSHEVMKEALITIKEKGIKSIDLLELSERGIKLPTDEPCFPIQVHAISPTEVKEKVIPPVEVTFTGYSNEIVYHQNASIHDIKANLEENSHKINYLREF